MLFTDQVTVQCPPLVSKCTLMVTQGTITGPYIAIRSFVRAAQSQTSCAKVIVHRLHTTLRLTDAQPSRACRRQGSQGCSLRSHLRPFVVAVVGPISGTRLHVGPSSPATREISECPTGNSRAVELSPTRTRFRWSWVASVFRLDIA
jgi:hypothetical protein